MPMGPGEVYTMFNLGDRGAGTAAYTLRKEQQANGVPPHWGIYVAVENVDASAKRVSELGGKVIVPPFDVFDAGRMSVVQDPTGAFFCLWQAKQKANAVTGVDGTLCWADLNTPNPDQATKFYSSLLGWKFEKSEHDSSGYLHIKNGEQYIGGLPPAAASPTRPSALAAIHSGLELRRHRRQSQGNGRQVLPRAHDDGGRRPLRSNRGPPRRSLLNIPGAAEEVGASAAGATTSHVGTGALARPSRAKLGSGF